MIVLKVFHKKTKQKKTQFPFVSDRVLLPHWPGSIILKYLVTVADTGSSEAVTAASPTAATTDFMSIKI